MSAALDAGSLEAEGTNHHPPLHLSTCWACDTRVQLPVSDSGRPVATFKCGFCGALTTPLPTDRVPQQHSDRQRPNARERARVMAVGILIATLVGLGVVFVLPHWPYWLHLPPTLWLSFMVLFNYHAAVTMDPGIVRCQLSDYRPVQQGSMDGYTYCPACKSAKPPDAHHCSTCGACIEAMDHHCPFIGNCVGAANRRWFIVFLYWTLVACGYTALMAVLTVWKRWDVARFSWLAFKRHFMWSRAYLFVFYVVRASPIWLCAVLYLLMASVSVLIAAGMLFQQQLIWVLTGISYVDALKMSKAPAGTVRPVFARRSLGDRLRDVFGNEPAWRWLLPSMTAASHSRTCKKGC